MGDYPGMIGQTGKRHGRKAAELAPCMRLHRLCKKRRMGNLFFLQQYSQGAVRSCKRTFAVLWWSVQFPFSSSPFAPWPHIPKCRESSSLLICIDIDVYL